VFVGEEGLADTDRRYLAFGTAFEAQLVAQDGMRTLEESLATGWKLLAELPATELSRLSDAQIARHLARSGADADHERRHSDPERRPRDEGRAPRDARGLRLPRREVPAARRRDPARARRSYDALRRDFVALHSTAIHALEAAISRHGLHGLQIYAAASVAGASLEDTQRDGDGRALQSVALGRRARLRSCQRWTLRLRAIRAARLRRVARPSRVAGRAGGQPRAPVARVSSVRRGAPERCRTVLLPELDRSVYEIESRLEELEQEDAIWMRHRVKS
jgi:hypothetical protein